MRNIFILCLCLSFTMLNSQTVLLEEDFSGGSLPVGWNNIDNGSSPAGDIWEFDDPGSRNITAGNFSGNYAILDSDNYGNGNSQDASLETVSFDTGTYTTVILEYDYQYRDYQSPESCAVEIYNGSSWVTVASYTTNSGDNYSSATHVYIDITTAVASASGAKVRFTYIGDWDWWWALDNIKVTGVTYVSTGGYLGPGGVGGTDGNSDLELWLRADKNVTSNGSDVVTAWLDQSGHGNDVSLIGGDPSYTALINSNQVITLDGDDYFQAGVSNNSGTAASVYFAGTITGYSSTWAGILSGSKSGELDWDDTDHVVFLNRNNNTDGIESHRDGLKSVVNNGLAGSDFKIMNSEYDGTENTIRLDGIAGTTVPSSESFDFNLIGVGKRITETKYTSGDYAEVIYFEKELNLAQKIIVENYLQAKYNGTLAANDLYDEDDPANGDFDFDVAGIGQASDGSNHTDSQGTGVVRINSPDGLGDNEFYFWGRNNKDILVFETNTSSYIERLNTTWRLSRTGNLGKITMTFDLSEMDLSELASCATLRLIIDDDSDFSSPFKEYDLTDLGGGYYRKEKIKITDNYYFTLEYQDKIVVDGTQFYNGSGSGDVPDTSDDCYKLLVKNTADGSLSLTENANVREIEVETGGKLVVDTGVGLIITNGIENSGDIRLLGTSQLIQNHTGTSQNLSSTGSFFVDQQGTNDSKYRFNYWSSPVAPVGEINYSIGAILKDGSIATGISTNPSAVNFTAGYDGDYTTSPITISSYWLYKYSVNWAQIGTGGELSPGQGYTMKGPGAVQGYTFVGVPNDGEYLIPVLEDDSALVGNPYPCALNATKFIQLNSIDKGIIDGSIYFWEHNGETSTSGNDGHYQSNYEGGYAVRNLVGGVAAVAPAGVSGLGTSSGDQPKQYIPIAQGFFVNAIADGDVVFNNDMRSFEEEGANSIFFKSGKEQKLAKQEELPFVLIGFDQKNDAGILLRRQLLAVFKKGLTDDYNNGYDSSIYDLQNNDAYWSFPEVEGKYVIAGIDEFITAKELPVEIEIGTAGLVYFSLLEQNIITDRVYLRDKLNAIYYGMSDNTVSLYLEPGSYSDRFFVTFKKDSSFSINEISVEKTMLIYTNSNKQLYVNTNSDTQIKKIQIYNLVGVLGLEYKSENSKIDEHLLEVGHLKGAIYIVRIETDTGVVSKKILIE